MELELSSLVDALPGLVWTASPDGRADYVGRGWLNYTGLTLDEAHGEGWLISVHPQDAPHLLSRWAQIIDSGEPGEVEARLRRHDGEYRWFLFRAAPMPDPDGQVRRWCGINTEIQDRVQAEAEAREQQRRFERVVDGLPVIAALFAPQGDIIFCNRLMLEYRGETLEEVQTRPRLYHYHPDDHDAMLSDWTSSLRTGAPLDRVARLRRADGVYLWHRTVVFPLRNPAGEIEVWYGLALEVEDFKRAEATLAAEKQLLELVAKGEPLPSALQAIGRQVEALSSGSMCSIVVVDPEGRQVHIGASSTLPAAYNVALEGLDVDPHRGPFSLAVTLKAPVISVDLAHDPRWAGSPWSALAAQYGLAACWSMPILSAEGDALGAFVLYQSSPRRPTPEELELVDRFAKIAGIAITRAQSDAALSEGEAQLKHAYDLLAAGEQLSHTSTFRWDVERDQHDWSHEAYQIWEFEPETKITMPVIFATLHPDDISRAEALIGAAIAGAPGFDFSFRIHTQTGVERHLHVVGRRLEEITDRPVFIGALRDVTEGRLAEDALRQANRYLTEAQRLSRTGSFTWDMTSDAQNWSEELYRIWEIEPGSKITIEIVLGQVHPDDLPAVQEALRPTAEGGDFDASFRIVTASGAVKHLHTVAHRLADAADRIVYIGATHDVTESKLGEQALRASEAELRRANRYFAGAQRLSQTGAFTWDVANDRQDWSDELYRMWEFDPAGGQTIEMVMGAVVPEDVPAIEAELTTAFKTGGDYEIHFRMVTKSGVLKYFHTVGKRDPEIPDRLVYMGFSQDVTAAKVAEEALNRARAELTHMARAMTLSTLTASIAHEVNQPLAGIITNASTCLRMLAADPPNIEGARSTMQRTLRDGNRASEVIRRLRGMFTRHPPTVEAVDLNDAAREVLALSAAELQGRRVALHADFAPNLPAVNGDRVQLQQVILNLVLNAADAMIEVGDNPRELRVETRRGAKGAVVLSVRDTGIGFDSDKVESLFEPFYTTKSEGMGIGLAISRSIVEAHEGRLWATPNHGPGSTFLFSIPSRQGSDLHQPSQSKELNGDA